MIPSKIEKSRPVEKIEQLASDLSISVWNRIAKIPRFRHLKPKDFALLFEAVHRSLKRSWTKNPAK